MVKLSGVENRVLKITKNLIVVVLATSFGFGEVASAKSTLTTTGDILQIALPVAAIGTAFLKDDVEGEKQFVTSFAANMAITNILKFSLKNTDYDKRPNGGHYSFPSGHTAAAFGGAFFMQQRYGIEYGAPTMALASLTAYSRVKGDYHHWRDVIGGAVIALATNYFMVTEYKPKDLKVALDKDSFLVDMKFNF